VPKHGAALRRPAARKEKWKRREVRCHGCVGEPLPRLPSQRLHRPVNCRVAYEIHAGSSWQWCGTGTSVESAARLGLAPPRVRFLRTNAWVLPSNCEPDCRRPLLAGSVRCTTLYGRNEICKVRALSCLQQGPHVCHRTVPSGALRFNRYGKQCLCSQFASASSAMCDVANAPDGFTARESEKS